MANKKEIAYKTVGQNVTVVIDGETIIKRIADKTIRASIKANVESYNKKNLVKLEKEIRKQMAPTQEKSIKKKVESAKKTVVKPAVAEKKASTIDLQKSEQVKQEANKKPVIQEAPIHRQRGGEY